jgi:zinc transporter ZupT
MATTPALKAAGALLLSAESLAGAFLPLALARRGAGALALASCFGGGVFLAAALLHLLPHCAEQHAGLLAMAGGGSGGAHGHHHHGHHHHGGEDGGGHHHDDHHHHHPRGGLSSPGAAAPPPYLPLVLLGYLLVLAAERVLFENAHDHGHGHGHEHHHHHDRHDAKKHEEEEKGDVAAATTPGRSRGRDRGPAASPRSPSRGRATTPSARPRRNGTGAAATKSPAAASSKAAAGRSARSAAGRTGKAPAAATPTPTTTTTSGLTPACLRSGLVAMLATSVHTLLECAALGLASDRRSFLALLAAVAAHKPASALALSARFLRGGATAREAAAYTSAFCLVAPLGIALGAFAGGPLGGAHAELWLSCLSCGAFLYVGMTEVIAEEMDGCGGWRWRWARFAALLGGVASVAAVGGHSH